MKLAFSDIGALGKPLVALVVALAVGAGATIISHRLLKQAGVDLAASRAALAEAQKRVQQSGDERDTILRYIGPYRELAQRGILGEESRLAWVDALRAANHQAQLYGVEYEVGAQQPYTFLNEVQAGKLPVQQSVMKLRLGLLYENDLLQFLRVLKAQNVGAFWVNHCSLQRVGSNAGKPVNAPTLRAECDISWITIPAPNQEEKS
jgi:hypothetical protein